jgi:ribonuclease T2
MFARSIVFTMLLLAAGSASAQIAMEGAFLANKACPALQSIKKGSNPGNILTQSGQSYRLVGKNSAAATHYFIEVPGARPGRRWVAVDCGTADGTGDAAAPVPPPASKKIPGGGNNYVLAISWQPAFCEGRPGKRECRRQTETSFEASHFTLHGLWPQLRRRVFCNVEGAVIDEDNASRWDELPEVELKPETRSELDKVMPGTQSRLDRHEWIKHGTCYPGADAEQYFADSLKLMRAINASAAQKLVASRLGREVTGRELRAAFDETFGVGAGERIRLSCKPDGRRNLIVEITIGLRGDITSASDVGELIRASQPTDAGCPRGIIDPVGLQ